MQRERAEASWARWTVKWLALSVNRLTWVALGGLAALDKDTPLAIAIFFVVLAASAAIEDMTA